MVCVLGEGREGSCQVKSTALSFGVRVTDNTSRRSDPSTLCGLGYWTVVTLLITDLASCGLQWRWLSGLKARSNSKLSDSVDFIRLPAFER